MAVSPGRHWAAGGDRCAVFWNGTYGEGSGVLFLLPAAAGGHQQHHAGAQQDGIRRHAEDDASGRNDVQGVDNCISISCQCSNSESRSRICILVVLTCCCSSFIFNQIRCTARERQRHIRSIDLSCGGNIGIKCITGQRSIWYPHQRFLART